MLSPTTGTPKQLSDSAPLSHLWLGDLVELKHLTKDIYLGKFSTVVHEKSDTR